MKAWALLLSKRNIIRHRVYAAFREEPTEQTTDLDSWFYVVKVAFFHVPPIDGFLICLIVAIHIVIFTCAIT